MMDSLHEEQQLSASADVRNGSGEAAPALTLGERMRQIEVDGYVVLPDVLSAGLIARLKAETARLETIAVDYTVHQRVRGHLEFLGGAITDLIAPGSGGKKNRTSI